MTNRRILKLDDKVVNRIAAGEVVQRPSAAVKEMLENCLDAGSTSITVTIKGGGMQLLQIQDNGHGIKKDDLGIVCERFTTSKLTTFDDLKSINTFGFRGEALASITHVANVTITSRTSDSPCAYKSKYSDGKLVPIKVGGTSDPQPCAGTVGTMIAVEDLFYNMPTRKLAFKNLNEQYQRVLDVVTRYSIHFAYKGVSFTCKKHGQGVADLHTVVSATAVDNIRVAYGSCVSKELLDVDFGADVEAKGNSSISVEDPSDIQIEAGIIKCNDMQDNGPSELKYHIQGKITNANYSSRKSVFLLFINDRLVECAAIKRIIESVYADILPKHTHPFVYLSLRMPAAHVDVNVHPTKKEVHFLHETELLQKVYVEVSKVLKGANESRTFYTQQALLPPLTGTQQASEYVEASEDKEVGGKVEKAFDAPDPGAFCTTGQSKKNDSSSGDKSRKSQRAVAGLKESKIVMEPARKAQKTVDPKKFVRVDHAQDKINAIFQPLPPLSEKGKARSSNTRKDISVPGSEEETQFLICGECDNSGAVPPAGLFASSTRIEDACACCGTEDADVFTHATSKFSRPDPVVPKHARKNAEIFRETTVSYDSVRGLLSSIELQRCKDMEPAIKQHVVVGLVDERRTAVQAGSKLLLLDHLSLSRHLFFQLVVRRFACLPLLSLSQSVDIFRCVRVALDSPKSQWTPEDGDKDKIAAEVASVLEDKASMLKEYFSIQIESMGDGGIALTAIPEVLLNHRPVPQHLPIFLLKLAVDINWENELECFQGIAALMALFYSRLPEEGKGSRENQNGDNDEVPLDLIDIKTSSLPEKAIGTSASDVLNSIVLPGIRSHLILPNECAQDGSIVQVANLDQLYKVFERC